MKLEEKAILRFLDRFDETPFLVRIREEEYTIGHGNPRFSIIFKKEPDLKEMITSTSLALGEAYMRGDLEIPVLFSRSDGKLFCGYQSIKETHVSVSGEKKAERRRLIAL